MKPSDIAVISPYAAQVRLLRNVLAAALTNVQDAEHIEISSIDAFKVARRNASSSALCAPTRGGSSGFSPTDDE